MTPPEQQESQAPASSGNLLLSTVAMGLETALQQLLKLDCQAGQAMEQLQGKIMALEFSDLGFSLFVVPGQPVRVYAYYEGEVHTRLKGSSVAFVAMGLRERSGDSLFSGDVQIQGDLQLGSRFQQILARLEIDWEEQLSKVTGDVIAHKLGKALRHLEKWGRESIQTLAMDVGEYTQEETRLLPLEDEVREFTDQVDALRCDTDRLLARAEKCLAQYRKNNTGAKS